MKIEKNLSEFVPFDEIIVDEELTITELDELEIHLSNPNNIKWLKFRKKQTPDIWKAVNLTVSTFQPDLKLYFYNKRGYGEWQDLSFLEFLSDIEDIAINEWLIDDLTPISNLTHLKKLNLNDFKSSKIRLKPLEYLIHIEEFTSSNIKDIEVLSNFNKLKKLGLRSLKVDNIDFMKTLLDLEDLSLGASERIIDFSGLYELPKLSKGFFGKNYKNESAEYISQLKNLEQLTITDYNLVTKFPSLQNLDKLTHLSVITFKNLNDISGISKAENLTDLSIYSGSKELKPENFKVFKGHSSLKNLRAGFLTDRVNKEFEALKNEILN